MLHARRLVLAPVSLALLAASALHGCGESERGGGALRSRLRSCGLLGRLEVRTALGAPRCGRPAAAGDAWEVTVNDAGEIRVRLAGYEMSAELDGDACTLVAEGCELDRIVEGGEASTTYRRTRVELRRGGDGPTAQLILDEALDAYDHDSFEAICHAEMDVALAAADADGCDFTAGFEAMEPARLVSGECGLTWDAGPVAIVEQGGGLYELSWAGTSIGELSLDESTCTLSGMRGDAESFDFWSYNGATRTVRISLRLRDGDLVGTVSDALDGSTFDGVSCSGAEFELVAQPRSADVGATQVFDEFCALERPLVCGDGICETDRGESCLCRDCACGDGTSCHVESNSCRARCTGLTEDCGAGMRCSLVEDESAIATPDRFLCVPSGGRGEGSRCETHDACVAGLICHVHIDRPLLATSYGLCQRPCDRTCECASGLRAGELACVTTCDRSRPDTCPWEDAFCWNPNPYAETGFCVAAPPEGLGYTGDACVYELRTAQCEPPGLCTRSCLGSDCEDVCSPVCTSDSDCPSSRPLCSSGACYER